MDETKICIKCEEKYPTTNEYFYKAKQNKDGLQNICKKCNKKYYIETRKNHYENNKDVKKQYQKEYYDNNKDERLNYAREYRNNNKEKIAQKDKNYRAKNKEKAAQYQKVYRIVNKDRVFKKQKEYWNKHRANKLGYNRKYREDNKEKISQYQKEYQLKNRVKILERKRNYIKENKEKIAEYYKKKYNKDLKFRIKTRMSTAIHRSLKGRKNGRRWEKLVGYTTQELISHLESQFQPGMTWENYGVFGWHIDHKRPIVSFNFKSPDDAEFKECWALENLQPLWAEDNLRKNGKWEAPKF